MYENKARATKCHAKNAAFYTKMHPLHGKRQQSSGPFGRLCTNCATIRGEMMPATVVALLRNLRIGDAEDLPTSSTPRMMGRLRGRAPSGTPRRKGAVRGVPAPGGVQSGAPGLPFQQSHRKGQEPQLLGFAILKTLRKRPVGAVVPGEEHPVRPMDALRPHLAACRRLCRKGCMTASVGCFGACHMCLCSPSSVQMDAGLFPV